MRNNTKFFLIYGFLSILFISLLVNWDTSLERKNLPSILPTELSELTVQKIFQVEQKSLFDLMTDVENYPIILPSNVIDVKIIERSENIIIAQEKLIERGIVIDLLVKHTFIPYETHTIEILDGDASGTKIEQTFQKFENNTLVKNKITFKLTGILTPFKFLPDNNAIHALETVLNQFEIYEETSTDETIKIIDVIYREILKRPADQSALDYYPDLLNSKQMSPSELRKILINSEELKSLLLPDEIIPIKDLNPETVKSVDKLYQKVLLRHVDQNGLKHFGSLIENNKLTFEELDEILLNSNERLSYEKDILKSSITNQFRDSKGHPPFEKIFNLLDLSHFKRISQLNDDTTILLNSTFNEILNRSIDDNSLQFFGILLDSKKISIDELRILLSEDCVFQEVRPDVYSTRFYDYCR